MKFGTVVYYYYKPEIPAVVVGKQGDFIEVFFEEAVSLDDELVQKNWLVNTNLIFLNQEEAIQARGAELH